MKHTFWHLLAVSTSVLYAKELGKEGYANSDGVKIHYVTAGEGPLVVMIHGFPDFWYSWRKQMADNKRSSKSL